MSDAWGSIILGAIFVVLVIARIWFGPKPSHHISRHVRELLERDAKQQKQIDAVVRQVETLLTNKRVKRITVKKRVKSGVQPKG